MIPDALFPATVIDAVALKLLGTIKRHGVLSGKPALTKHLAARLGRAQRDPEHAFRYLVDKGRLSIFRLSSTTNDVSLRSPWPTPYRKRLMGSTPWKTCVLPSLPLHRPHDVRALAAHR
jgi:hypothetical protein